MTYTRSGEPAGPIKTSYSTIGELLDKQTIPLSRSVIKAKRTLYIDHTSAELAEIKTGGSVEPPEIPDADVDIRFLDDTVNNTVNYMNTQLGGIQSEVLSADSLPEWYLSWQTLNRLYHSTWTNAENGNLKSFTKDAEFLREPIQGVDGFSKLGDSEIVTADDVEKTSMSLLRGLGPRSTRVREKEPGRVVDPAEEASSTLTLIFPLSEQRSLGSTRSGFLVRDVVSGMAPLQSMSDIFARLGGISPDKATTAGIIAVGVDGNTNGSILIEDWISNQPLIILGLSDAMVALSNYGFSNQELNIDQQKVLVDTIDKCRGRLYVYISEMRGASEKALTQRKMVANPFLVGEAEGFIKVLESESLLLEAIKEIQNSLPLYKGNDIAIVAGLMLKHADFFMATMAQVGAPLARERNRTIRAKYLQTRFDKTPSVSYAPEPNFCPHIKDLMLLRREKDYTTQMHLFSKFLTRYEGQRKDNWVDCSVCKNHLVCYHDVLLLKEFLFPKEREALHKEVLLSFSGGQFHGKYICKNCGQPISDIDFDSHMEFSDDGAPLSGRAALGNEEVALSDLFNEILGPDAPPEDEIDFATEDQRVIYLATRKLFDTLGIHGKEAAYKRILQRVESELLRQPKRDQYKQMTKGRKVLDYDILINRVLVASIGVNALIEIQTDVPGYVLRYKLPGCRAGFSGYPVGKKEDLTGLEYIVCAIASIKENAIPWSATGFQNEADKKRSESIKTIVSGLLESFLTNVNVQQQISVKRAFLQKVYGSVVSSEQLPENIPAGFRPFPYVVSGEAAAETPVVSDAATPREKIRGWVASAHQLAKENGNYVKGNPLSDATCCIAPIKDPGSFWKENGKTLPTLPFKSPPRGPIDSHLTVHFKARPMDMLDASISTDIMYRIFLKICYDGPRIGLPHEPGYTNMCAHCGYIYPYNPYVARPLPPFSKDSLKEYNQEVSEILTSGKSSLATQNIAVNKQTFDNLLDTAHRNSRVPPYKQKDFIRGQALLDLLRNMKPEPFEGWTAMINETIQKIQTLPPNASDIEFASAYGAISDFADQAIQRIGRRDIIGEENGQALKIFLEDSNAIETIRTYVLIPVQRVIIGFHAYSLKFQGSNELSSSTQDDINTNLKNHVEFISILQKRAQGVTLEKMKWMRSRLADAIAILQKYVREIYIPGGGIGLPYITTALLGGILGDFVDPDSTPPGMIISGMIDVGSRGPMQILDVCVQKMRKEGLRYTDQQVQEIINRRDEIEKLSFIKRFENLTPQEKAVVKMNQKLGLKEWAVGGTKAIYAYDPEQYERERAQREEMGFTELIQGGIDEPGLEDGYENQQIREDDF